MPTKGNTGQSSDDISDLGKKQGWHGAGMGKGAGLPGSANPKGLRGFGSNDMGVLGKPTCPQVPVPGSDGNTSKPKSI